MERCKNSANNIFFILMVKNTNFIVYIVHQNKCQNLIAKFKMIMNKRMCYLNITKVLNQC
jgi:hypothetical protein